MGDALKGYFTDLMRKWKQDPSFVLPELKRVIVTRWLSNPYTLGAYSYRDVDSDALNITQSDLAKPITVNNVPRILLAGEATSEKYYTAVHGALDTGAREALRIVNLK